MDVIRPETSIDCARCPKRRGEAECEDCLVAYILDRPEGAVVFNAAEERAIRALRAGGLLSELRIDTDTG